MSDFRASGSRTSRARAYQMFDELARVNGLTGWHLTFDRAVTRLGQCRVSRREISLSMPFLALNDEQEVRGVILHEIAHALAGAGHGHDATWRNVCRRIGADPARINETAVVKDAPWSFICACGRTAGKRHRRSRSVQYGTCGVCGSGLAWTHR